jgi:hypothetical protein
MGSLDQIPVDYKKYLDAAIKEYLPSKKGAIDLFDLKVMDSGLVTHEYVRRTQSYSSSKGWTSFDDPDPVADGARPTADDIGLETNTSAPTRYGKGFRLDQAILNAGTPIIRDYIAKFGLEKVEIIRNYVNRTLITNMGTNAAQSYSGANGTWASGADPFDDIIGMQSAFKIQAGGIDADFALINPTNFATLRKDLRIQSTIYTTKSLETGTITPRPLGLDWVEDQAVTAGTMFIGKKGLFGTLFVTENMATYETSEGAAGKTYDIMHKWEDQYPLPYYLMKCTTI